MIKKNGNELEKLSGKVVRYSEDGVLFDEDKSSLVNNPEPKFYNKKDIEHFVDESGNLVFGKNQRLKHDVKKVKITADYTPKNSKNSKKSYSFKADVGQPFSYCITPG